MIFDKLLKTLRTRNGETEKSSSRGIIGYLGVIEGQSNALPNLAPGVLVDNKTDAPPWIVVDHDLMTMVVSNWPFSLWKVQVLKPINPQEHRGNYTRCSAIKVLEPLPSYKVFGEIDTGLCDILEFARGITLEQAHELSDLRSESASAIYSLAWHRWLQHNPTQPNGQIKNYDDVLDIGGTKGGSPIGSCLKLINRVLFDQAGRIDLEYAYKYEDDGTPFLNNHWNAARSTLSNAALSFGARKLFDSSGIAEMRRPLRQVSPSLVHLIEEKTFRTAS